MNRSTARDLNRVEFLFAQWRDRYPKGKRPPEPLWAEAVALLDRFPVAVIADRLGISPSRLAARHAAAHAVVAAPEDSTPGPIAPRVLEIGVAHLLAPRPQAFAIGAPDSPSAGRSACVEIDRPDGARLRLTLPGLDTVALAALCQAFLQTP